MVLVKTGIFGWEVVVAFRWLAAMSCFHGIAGPAWLFGSVALGVQDAKPGVEGAHSSGLCEIFGLVVTVTPDFGALPKAEVSIHYATGGLWPSRVATGDGNIPS